MLLEGDLLSVYSRVFADTGENGGDDAGEKSDVRHRSALEAAARSDLFPRRRTAVAAERTKMAHPIPCCAPAPHSLMAANTATNGTRTVQAGLPKTCTSMRRNISAEDIQAWTADYRVSWHQKVANGQTIEPYAHVQDNGYRDKGTQGAQLGGVGGPLEYLDRRDALRRPGRTKSVSASNINIPLRRLINVTESATTRFSPLECTGKCVSSFSYC